MVVEFNVNVFRHRNLVLLNGERLFRARNLRALGELASNTFALNHVSIGFIVHSSELFLPGTEYGEVSLSCLGRRRQHRRMRNKIDLQS